MFALAQISGFIAWLCLLVSYYRKNTDKILVFHILSIVFYLLNYLFLGAWTGLFIVVLELARDFLYYKTDKDNLVFLVTLPFYIVLFIFAKDNFIELVPIMASILEGFTLTKKKSIVVPGAIIVYSMWVIYDISVGAYTGALTDGLIVISNIGVLVNMIKGFKRVNSFKISSRYSINKDAFDRMICLKKDIYAKEILLSNSYEEKLYSKSKNNFMFIKYNKDLKGYITKIRITKDTLNRILEVNEVNNEYENIILESSLNGKSLLIDSIVLKEKYQNRKAEELIVDNIKKLVRNKKYNNIIILASTPFEKDIAKDLNFINLKELNDKSIIYSYKGN